MDNKLRNERRVSVIIPAINEEQSIGKVIQDIPDWVDEIIVVDNGSNDNTASVAASLGTTVVSEPARGYGNACLAGIGKLAYHDIVVFLDGDYSDYPEEMAGLVDPIISGEFELIIGSRILGKREHGALTPQARFGNWLSCLLIKWIWKVHFTDLGPFRAINYNTLNKLNMEDHNYGWTVEMQIKAAQSNLAVMEVPVNYRRRIGKSKVSGTVRGVVFAGTKILWTIFRSSLMQRGKEI